MDTPFYVLKYKNKFFTGGLGFGGVSTSPNIRYAAIYTFPSILRFRDMYPELAYEMDYVLISADEVSDLKRINKLDREIMKAIREHYLKHGLK